MSLAVDIRSEVTERFNGDCCVDPDAREALDAYGIATVEVADLAPTPSELMRRMTGRAALVLAS